MKSLHLADRMSRLGTESAFEVLAKANALEAQGHDVVHLEIGQPDFGTPKHIIEAAHKAMLDGYTGYTNSQGIPETRQAVSRYCQKYKHIHPDIDEIVMTPGAKPIMFYIMLALCGPGDEVLYPNPGFPIYESCINFTGAKAIPIPILQKNNFRIDIEELKTLITPRTKLIILNSPQNPTGGLLRRQDIEAIAGVIRESGSDTWILSDEVYDRLIFTDEPAFSIKSIPDMYDRTILLDGFSKTYAMTGWRLGYGIMNKELASAVTQLIINSASCAAAFTQIAAIAALEGPQDEPEQMKKAFRERTEYMVQALNKIDGIDCLMPDGSFYVFPSIRGLNIDSKTFAERLLYEADVAVLSGSAFGIYGEDHIRLSVANSMENIQKAAERIADFVNHRL